MRPGLLTVTPAALTITADNQTKVYGAALPTLTASYTGFVNGDTPASLTRSPRSAPPPPRPATSAAYTITASGAADLGLHDPLRGRHAHRHVRELDDHGRQPDQGLRRGVADAHRVSYSGFVNGDTAASLTTQPTLDDDRHRQQPRRGQPLHHHRQRRGRFQLHDQLRRREL